MLGEFRARGVGAFAACACADPADVNGHRARGNTSHCFRALGADDAPGVTGDQHRRTGTPSPCIQRRTKRALHIVPFVLQPQRPREIAVGHHALMQEHGVHRFHARCTANGILNLAHLRVALDRELRDALVIGNARRLEFAQQSKTLAHVTGRRQKAGQARQRCPAVDFRFQYCGGLDTGTHQLRCQQQQQRPAARKHETTLRHETAGLQHGLCCAAAHYTGQRPARNGHGAFHRTGCDQEFFCGEHAHCAMVFVEEAPVSGGFDLPDLCVVEVFHFSAAQRASQFKTRSVIRPQPFEMFGARGGEPFNAPIDLSTRFGLFIQQRHAKAQVSSGDRGGHARRAGADNGEIERSSHSRASRTSRLPC